MNVTVPAAPAGDTCADAVTVPPAVTVGCSNVSTVAVSCSPTATTPVPELPAYRLGFSGVKVAVTG